MEIIERASGHTKPVTINIVEEKDFKLLTKNRYSFTWKSIKDIATIYKLQISGEEDILGVMGLMDVPGDKRMEIKLLSNSIENRGKNKIYNRIAGCLIAFAGSQSVAKYGDDASISLVPKTELINHYMRAYYMSYGGRQLYLEGGTLKKLLQEYYL
jgi:hypothetical protein